MEKIQKNLQKTYDLIANDFDAKRPKTWSQVDNFLKKNNFVGNNNVLMLDMFAGSGRHSFYKTTIISTDFSVNMLKLINKKKTNKEKAPFPVLCDSLNLPFIDNCFDCIVCIAGIHHFKLKKQRKQVLYEMKRVLKKGGKFIISTWSKNAFEKDTPKNYFCKWDKKHFRYYYLFEPKEFEELVESCRLKIEHVFEDGIGKAKNIWIEGRKNKTTPAKFL